MKFRPLHGRAGSDRPDILKGCSITPSQRRNAPSPPGSGRPTWEA